MGVRAKKSLYLKWASHFLLCTQNFSFTERIVFWFWVGGWFSLGALGLGLSSRAEEGLKGPRSASCWGSQAAAHLTHTLAMRLGSGACTS